MNMVKKLILLLGFVIVSICSEAAILEDGKIWITKTFSPYFPDQTKYVHHRYYVDGTQIVNGKIYKVVKLESSDGMALATYLLYEDNNVLYWRVGHHDDPEVAKYEVDGDLPVIDLNYQVGDTLYFGEKVVSVDEQIIRGATRKVIKFDNNFPNQTYWIEGIGTTNEWYVFPITVACSFMTILDSCYQGDTCLYKAGDLPDSDFNGLESIMCEPDESAALYDMMGRRVDHPQPGSLYIRNGKKLIWWE